ncbi:MAG: SMC-Scp complex subunit ScpB [Terracidiphilus sp.]|jgi:segregation and condensation protein B
MSLKAKLEAVIYAAEEPVTLAQLATLFASEALDWKAEQAAASAQIPQADDSMPLLPQEFEPLGQASPSTAPTPTDSPAEAAESISEASPDQDHASSPGTSPEASAETTPEVLPEAVPDTTPDANITPVAAELEEKRLARLRDREVRAILRQLLDELIASYASDTSGIEIREIAGGYRMATKPECHDAVRAFVKSLKPPLKLSLPALETLAVIAYKQPVTAPEVNEIRGVDSSGVFGSLLARKLIAAAGRKQVIGRPILYKTTREFLLRFGLKDVAELPSMEEFEKIAAIELDEPEPSSGEDSALQNAPDSDESLDLDFNESAEEDLTDEVADASPETPVTPETAETAACTDSPTPEEAAPAAPPATEQAETETLPHAQEDQEVH